MKLQMVGCSHQNTPVELRERLAFTPDQTREALAQLRDQFPDSEAVLLSTCNRVELYTAAEEDQRCPSREQVVDFLAGFHKLTPAEIAHQLLARTGPDAVRHLFLVAASLDSMVVGEAQILSQVKQAYELARASNTAKTLTNLAFQAAIRTAKRVARETTIHQRRVSIPSVAIADFASQIFERFDDKQVLLIGAGEMGQEAMQYLLGQGARQVTVINRSPDRARQLAERFGGQPAPWDQLAAALVAADLVISTTGATQPILTLELYKQIEPRREQRTLFILDLAVPRDVDPDVGERLNVYLYSIDDLKAACERNRKAREKEWPKAQRIIDEETARFLADLNHRATGPVIRRLRAQANEVKQAELRRLINKLGTIDPGCQQEIEKSFDRLVNKLLHPPLESLRDEAEQGQPHRLIEALKQLFQLRD